MIALPPLLTGAVKLTLAEALPPVAVTAVGAPGTVAGVTLFEGVPTMYSAILNDPKADRANTATLEVCVSGGAAMPVEVMRAFEEQFGCQVLEGYGLSETSPVASFNRRDRERKPGSIGLPVDGVEMQILGSAGAGKSATSGGDGIAHVALREGGDGPHVLVAKKGDDVAILPENWGWWNEYGGWYTQGTYDQPRFYTFDDRHMYRPGETVSVKGWLRTVTGGPKGDVAMTNLSGQSTVSWTAYDAYGNEMGKGTADMTPTGGFSFQYELPATPNLGYARFDLVANGAYGSHGFQIQEFRRPEFEVSASVDPGPYVLGEHATVEVNAAYYAGGALPGAEVVWSAHAAAKSCTM